MLSLFFSRGLFGGWCECGSLATGANAVLGFVGTSTDATLPIAVLLGMIASVLLTGALHEDGFADTCDGLGGGWTPEERLRIMKDSRIGTYGALGLVFLILLKFFTLLQIETEILPLVWFAGHALSRFASISQLHFLTYVQDVEKSKSGTMTEFSGIDLIVNAAFGLLPLIFIGIMFGWHFGRRNCLVGINNAF